MRKPADSAALSGVLGRARGLARELGRPSAGTEHLLLALAQENSSSAGRILRAQGAGGRLLLSLIHI